MTLSSVGKELKPTKFGITTQKTETVSPSQPKDNTAGNAPSPQESVNQHTQSDVDSSAKSQHHTLGTRPTQASPGNHIHDGITSPKLGPRQMAPGGNGTVPALVLTGSKGGNVALTNLIAMLKNFVDFTDNTT
jgi:hypothetical protein